MKHHREREVLIAIFTLAFLSLLFFGNKVRGMAADKEKRESSEYITMAIPGTLNAMNFYHFEVGQKRGFYLKEGINLELVMMKGSIIPMALASKSIHYVGSSGQVIRAALVGIPVKLLLLGGRREPTFLVSRPEIRTLSELKGKRIAISALGDSEHLGIKETLGLFGLDPEKDVTLVATGPAIKEQALLGGSVDAAVTNFANIYLVRERGFKELIKDLVDYSEHFRGLGQGLGTRTETLKRNPLQVKRVIRAKLKSILYCRDNPKEIVDYIHQNWGWEMERAREFHHIFLKIMPKNFSNPDRETIERQVEMRETGLKRAPGITFSDFLDFTITREVEKELGILP